MPYGVGVLRAVVFDLFNTLVDDLSDGRVEVLRLMAGDLGADPDQFVERFHETYPQRIIGVPATLAEQCRQTAEYVGERPGPTQIDAAVQRRLAFNRQLFTVPRTTLRVLHQLRDDCFAVGMISNLTPDSATVLRETSLPGMIDALALSCELGVAKPDPAIYRSVIDQLGLTPQECLFVGDGADGELRGAEAVGMRALQICEFADSDPTWDGPTIARLSELVDHL